MTHILELIILKIAEKKLKSVDIKNHLLYDTYKQYLPLLSSCYKEAYYWHGTGRYHYKLKGQSKYEGIDFSQTYDVLQSIIESGGITPQFDPFIKINNQSSITISLTKYRMYARAYVEFNQYVKSDLEYTFGSIKFWFYFLAPLQILHNNFILNILLTLRSLISKNFIKKSQPWVNTFKKESKDRWSVLNFYKLRSDIPGNYGILFGIKDKGVHPVRFSRIVERFETRADNLIKLENITHIEVTLSRVKEIEVKLRQSKISIPVIPIEVGELYASQFSLAFLSGIDYQDTFSTFRDGPQIYCLGN